MKSNHLLLEGRSKIKMTVSCASTLLLQKPSDKLDTMDSGSNW